MGGQHQQMLIAGRTTTFPVFESATLTSGDVANNNCYLNKPATVNSGDIMFAFFGYACGDTPSTFTWPSSPTSWTKLGDWNYTFGHGSFGYRIATGSEGGGNVVVTSSIGGETYNRRGYIIRISGNHASQAPEWSIANFTGNPNPPSLSPSWGSAKTLWLAGFISQAELASSPISAWPSNYENQYSSIGAAQDMSVAICTRQYEASSEDPGAFTFDGDYIGGFTAAIRPQ